MNPGLPPERRGLLVLWRRDNVSTRCPSGRGVDAQSDDEKCKQRDLPAHDSILQVV